jgi:DNA-binding transcriptional LysR family regulator
MASILEKTTGLVAFVRTVDAGSFSAASRLIGSSQSAVSKSVGRLEHRLGVRLIQRSTRTLSLTSEGSAYYERVAPLLRAIEEAEDVVQVASEAKGLLRVSAPQEFGRLLIATWAPEFLARHPGVKLELNVTDRNVDIIRKGTISPFGWAPCWTPSSSAASWLTFTGSSWRHRPISRSEDGRRPSRTCDRIPVCGI